MVYENTKTGATITTDSILSGAWQPIVKKKTTKSKKETVTSSEG